MALSGIKPFVHVSDSNGNPYVGAKLYVYLPGTTTLASIYSDTALSVSIANPMTGANASDAAGNFPRFYIAAGTYKLRAETSAGVLIWQYDNIDTGLSAGSGALPVASGGTGGTTATAARTNLDVPSNADLTTLTASLSSIQASLQTIVSIPQGRLTLTSGTPVLTTGVTAGTSVYYTPFRGNLVPIYDGIVFNTSTFTELTLTLSANHPALNIYDIFIFKNAGTVTIGSGPAWNSASAGVGARGAGAGTTELTRTIGGILTNLYSMTARNGATTYTVAASQGTYVGSMYMDGTNGQLSCLLSYGQSRKWGLWNAYNRVPIIMKAGDPTATWNYAIGTFRQSNASAGNTIAEFTGLAEEIIRCQFIQNGTQTVAAGQINTANIVVGWNATSSGVQATQFLGNIGAGTVTWNYNMKAEFIQTTAPLGVNNVTSLEKATSPGGGTTTFVGAEADMVLSVQYNG